MPLKLKTKQDRQLWQFLSPNQREFAKSGKCINLTADYLPGDIPTRFVFVCLDKMLSDYIQQEDIDEVVYFENYLKLFFESGIFKATKHPTKDTSQPFNLPSAVIRSHYYKNLPKKYQVLVLSKVDMNFEHISELVIC